MKEMLDQSKYSVKAYRESHQLPKKGVRISKSLEFQEIH